MRGNWHIGLKSQGRARLKAKSGRLISLAGLGVSALILSACSTLAPPPPPPPPPGLPGDGTNPSGFLRDWRGVIVPQDLDRYQRLDEAWAQGLRQARQQRGSGNLQRLGDLIIPGAIQDFPTPPEGQYRCRTIKLGSQAGEEGLGYVVYGWFACRIDLTPGGLKLSKLTGSQRPSGLLFPENNNRMVFLGSMAVSNEAPADSYGQKPDRDMVGVLERIDEKRWRLSLPWPQNESHLDLIELVPVSGRR